MKNIPTMLAITATFALTACNDKPLNAPPAEVAAEPSAVKPPVPAAKFEKWQTPQTAVPQTELCAIDVINGAPPTPTVIVAANKPLSVAGWVSSENLTNPGDFGLTFEGRANSFIVNSKTGIERPDVVEGYKAPGLKSAGFAIDLATVDIPAGEYKLGFIHQGALSAVTCAGRVSLTVQ